MRYILAWFCPWLGFLTIGKPGKAFFAFILQCTLIGWPIAFWWSIISTAHYYADKRTDRIVNAIKETRPPQPNFGYPGYQPPPGIPPQYPQQIPRPSAPAIMARYEHRSTPQPPQNDGYESIMQHDDAARPEPEWQSAPEPMPRPEPQRRARPEPTPARNIGDMLGSFSFPRSAQGPAEPIDRTRLDEPRKLTDTPAPPPLPHPRERLVEPGFLLAMVFIVLIVAAIPGYKFLVPMVGSIKFPHIFATSPPQPVQPTQAEVVFWQSVMNSKNPGDYQQYLDEYPHGIFAGLARSRIHAAYLPSDPTQIDNDDIAAASPLTCQGFRRQVRAADDQSAIQFVNTFERLTKMQQELPSDCQNANHLIGGRLVTDEPAPCGTHMFALYTIKVGAGTVPVIIDADTMDGTNIISALPGQWVMAIADKETTCTFPSGDIFAEHLLLFVHSR